MKKFLTSCFVVLAIFSLAATNSNAQTITTLQQKIIDYKLPYPGILPDNPLYFIKQLRDSYEVFVAHDQLKKAEAHLQISDKDISASTALAKKGKHKFTVEMVDEAENQFQKAIDIVKDDKKKYKEFILTLQKANLKHRESIENLMKDMPQGEVENMQKLREKNMQIGKSLDSLAS